jgi:hypothetical protein
MTGSNNKSYLNEGSRCITYHSRMRYLKSREGKTAASMDLLRKRPSDEESILTSFPFTKSLNTCSTERLLPPIQLMTKEKSLRHIHRLRHPPNKVTELEFFHKKKSIRENVRARIHAEQLAVLQINDRTDTMIQTEKYVNSFPDNITSQKSEKERYDHTITKEKQVKPYRLHYNSNLNCDVRRADILSEKIIGDDDRDERHVENPVGTTFAFLEEWRKESKSRNISRLVKKGKPNY